MEIIPSTEGEHTLSYDAIVVLGRGIGKDPKGKWRPQSYFARMQGGVRPHSGIFDNTLDPNSEASMVGGSNANVLAAYHMFRKLSELGIAPALVIFAAGRPPYLENEDESLSEGSVLKEQFMRKLVAKKLNQPETIILNENKTTSDDIRESIKKAKERGLKNIVFITVGVHTERSEEFLNTLPSENLIGVQADFISSEEILKGVSKRYKDRFEKVEEATGYKTTVEAEARGIKALRSGNY